MTEAAGSEDKPVTFGPVPDALVDRRTIYRKADTRWYAADLEDVEPGDLIVVKEDPEFDPDSFQLWLVAGYPYKTRLGHWTVLVSPGSSRYNSLGRKP